MSGNRLYPQIRKKTQNLVQLYLFNNYETYADVIFKNVYDYVC